MIGAKKYKAQYHEGSKSSSGAKGNRTPRGSNGRNVVGNAYESTPTKPGNGPTKGSPKGM
jgi:hypothetical protein